MYASINPSQPEMTKQPLVKNRRVYLACRSNGEGTLGDCGAFLKGVERCLF